TSEVWSMPAAMVLYQASTFCALLMGETVLPSSGTASSLSWAYIVKASDHCLRSLRQAVTRAFSLALASAGSSSAARIAMIAITTRSSMRVKAPAPFLAHGVREFMQRVIVVVVRDAGTWHTINSSLQVRLQPSI